jgi:hypothetical protein
LGDWLDRGPIGGIWVGLNDPAGGICKILSAVEAESGWGLRWKN